MTLYFFSQTLGSTMLGKLVTLFKTKPRYNDEVVDKTPDEYSLLVSKRRIVDYSKIKKQLNLPIKIGMYMDTYAFLKDGQDKASASSNIEKVLVRATKSYQDLLKEKFGEINDGIGVREAYTASFDRTQLLYEVTGLSLNQHGSEAKFCVNLFTRPKNKSFIIVGRQPKFSGKRPSRIDGEPEKADEDKEAWEYIEFE